MEGIRIPEALNKRDLSKYPEKVKLHFVRFLICLCYYILAMHSYNGDDLEDFYSREIDRVIGCLEEVQTSKFSIRKFILPSDEVSK